MKSRVEHGRSNHVSVSAPAKVNLHLGVGALRRDGYHEVVTVLQSVSLADTVRIGPAERPALACDPGVGVPAEENLAWKAAERLAAALGREAAVRIELEKAVPSGAGLGGGSSDAAAVLVGACRMWGLDTADPAVGAVVGRVAAGLGADVPFFLGGGTALYDGRGDRLVRRLSVPAMHLVLVRPPLPVPTAAAYAEFDRSPQPATSPDALIAACEAGDVRAIAAALANNMEAAACALVPDVADALGWLRTADGVLGAAVSGSGSAIFGICADVRGAASAAKEAVRRGWWAAPVTSRSNGAAVFAEEERV